METGKIKLTYKINLYFLHYKVPRTIAVDSNITVTQSTYYNGENVLSVISGDILQAETEVWFYE